MTVYTIGYEGINAETFLSLLHAHDIEAVVDIREFPLSRKPGFSKNALHNLLNLDGFEYIHMVALGCPKNVRDRYRVDGNWAHYTEGFLRHLEGQEEAIAELADLVNGSNCALLCYEADFNFCHRSMVAEAVRNVCGADIEHIVRDVGLRTTRSAHAQMAISLVGRAG